MNGSIGGKRFLLTACLLKCENADEPVFRRGSHGNHSIQLIYSVSHIQKESHLMRMIELIRLFQC